MKLDRVRTAASTSNLGPGFDFLGLALDLWLEVEREDAAGGEHELRLASDEARAWPRGDSLLLRAFDAALEAHGAPPRPSLFHVRSDIPLERGLGSSGAAVAAGLFLGALACDVDSPDRGRLAELGTRIEGHPDNVCASLLGGCTLAVPLSTPLAAGELRVVRAPLCESLRFTVAWTSAGLTTRAARAALPESVPFADAVENPRRLALLLEGLRTGDEDLLALGVSDRLHVAARARLIPGAAAALEAARRAGASAATLSGAGSALVALHDTAAPADEIGRAMTAALAPHAEWTRFATYAAAREGTHRLPGGDELHSASS